MQGPGHWSSLLKKLSVEHTLTLGYLYCEFTFRAQFQYVVCKYDLNCVETRINSHQRKARFMDVHTRWKALVH